VVIADSDIRVAPDYLAQVVSGLVRQGGGAVTSLLRHFHRCIVVAVVAVEHDLPFLARRRGQRALRPSRPCFGSTIAPAR
jgi:ceramide glucosyltransferase